MVDESPTILPQRRDRLTSPWCAGEPVDAEYQPFQRALSLAYTLKDNGALADAYNILDEQRQSPKTQLQVARTSYLAGEYFRQQDLLGQAADHFSRGAEAAWQVADMALFAQLKSMESAACYGSNAHEKRYRRAYLTARDALNAWGALSFRRLAADIIFEFKLADDLGVRAQMVAEDSDAVAGMERAAVLLQIMHERTDIDPAVYANNALYLEWDWAAISHSIGDTALAFSRVMKARELAMDSRDQRNFGRIHALIAEIALECVDAGIVVDGYKRARMLNVAEESIHSATRAATTCGDVGGIGLALLAHAHWLRLRYPQKRDERMQLLDAAQRHAESIEYVDPILLGRVEIAWGDEYAYRRLKSGSKSALRTAVDYYSQAVERLRDVEAFGLARIATNRLVGVTQPGAKRPVHGTSRLSGGPSELPGGPLSRRDDLSSN